MVRQIKAVLCIGTAFGALMRCSGYHDIFPVTVAPTHIYYVNRNSTAAISDGKQDSPFKSIQTAIENAYLNGTPAEVQVATGTYNEPVILRNGVSLYGGYDAGFTNRNTATYISTITTPTSTAVYADASVSANTTVDGFTIYIGTLNGVDHAVYLNGASATISGNDIRGGTATCTYTYGVACTAGCKANINGNKIQGGNGSSQSTGVHIGASNPAVRLNTINGGTSTTFSRALDIDSSSNPVITLNNIHGGYAANISYGINNTGTPTITNNVVYGGNGPSSRAITNNGSPVITNNVLHAGTGFNASASAIYSNSASYPTVTNNLFVANGAIQKAFFEQTTTATARSLENNAFWDFNSASTLTVYYNCDAGPCSDSKTSIAPMESLTDWPGGGDKARGNLLLTAGANGNPFTNVPQFWDRTNAAGTTTTFATSQFAKYTNGDYIEFNGDGIAHQITGCAGACASSPITFTTALSSATTTSMEVRNWGAKSSGGSQYAVDYHLAQNSLTGSVWNNIRYGGKNTSGANCGAPAGGVGTGAGGESCGSVTTDYAGTTRTTANAAVATNNTVPNGSAGATASVPGGFSIGAYESD